MIIPPGHYSIIRNPVIQTEDLNGANYTLKIAHKEVRFHQVRKIFV